MTLSSNHSAYSQNLMMDQKELLSKSSKECVNQSSIVFLNPDSPYADLGEVESANLLSFTCQIASGMVSYASL